MAPKIDVLTSGSPAANRKSAPNYLVLITIFFPNFTYPVRCFRVNSKMSSRTPELLVPHAEDHRVKRKEILD
jgi:hypothetical protein